MTGAKIRNFTPLPALSLEELVPKISTFCSLASEADVHPWIVALPPLLGALVFFLAGGPALC